MRTHDKSVLELLNMLETRCAHAAVALREAHEISVQVIIAMSSPAANLRLEKELFTELSTSSGVMEPSGGEAHG